MRAFHGGGRPSNRAPLVELVARRLDNQGGTTVVLGDDAGRNDDWRHKGRAGGGLPDVLMPATISPTCRRMLPNLLLLTTSTTSSRRCLPNLLLRVSSLPSSSSPPPCIPSKFPSFFIMLNA
jgi:hypothetical protein